MKKIKALSLLLAGMLSISAGVHTVYASESEIADAQAWKQEAEAGLAQAQANISSLESKKYELESYLADLNAQYDELTGSISELSIEAAEKEEELKRTHKELKKAKKKADRQYESMKIRIAYMYENGGASALELLLSAGDFGEFLNRAENVSRISRYDREMLEKYNTLCTEIREKEQTVQAESDAVNELMNQRFAMKQEIQALAEDTRDSISAYVWEISAGEEEAAALMSEISSADDTIAALVQQAEAAAAEEAASEETSDDGENDIYDFSGDYGEDSDSDSAAEEDGSYEENDSDYESEEDASESGDYEDTEEQAPSGSGQGTYLGNFTLTAYCNCAQCCGTAGNLTASGTVPAQGRTVAMGGIPFGTQLLINGNVYTVEDLGTPYGHVDIFFSNHSEALSFGLQSADVYRL